MSSSGHIVDKPVVSKLKERLAERTTRNQGLAVAAPATAASAVVPVQRALFKLPDWSKNLRGVPNVIARSALVAVMDKKNLPREQFKQHVITSVRGVTIKYTGEQWCSDELDVLMTIWHVARNSNIGEKEVFYVKEHKLLQMLDWGTRAESYVRLRRSIAILAECTLWVEQKKAVPPNKRPLRYKEPRRLFHRLALVTEDDYENESMHADDGKTVDMVEELTGEASQEEQLRQKKAERSRRMRSKMMISIDEMVAELFNPSLYTLIEWQKRAKLRSPIAKQLHLYFATHREPGPISTELLRDLIGSQNGSLSSVRQKLENAFRTLRDKGLFADFVYNSENDTWQPFHVARNPEMDAVLDPEDEPS